uniref:Reverse transcriptase domain-containing protein n=1 Tax=Hordeum vulgare subsp. vulgare TaxID=112509 RepID=A0A8I7B869_HORVV
MQSFPEEIRQLVHQNIYDSDHRLHLHNASTGKVNSLESLTQFHPINLCNMLYKIATKVLANKLKVDPPIMIFGKQSVFVPGTLIIDNTLVAYECVHAIRQGKMKILLCEVMLDMMNTYDRVEYNFWSRC